MELYEKIVFTLLFSNIACRIVVDGQEHSMNVCENKTYQKNTLLLLHEQVIVDSFSHPSMYDEKEITKSVIPDRFEASDVVLRHDGLVIYIVFDNTFQIGAFCTPLAARSMNCTDKLLAWPDEMMPEANSEFEGMAYNLLNDTYFVVQETVPSILKENKFQPNIFEIRITTNDSSSAVHLLESCLVKWEFDSTSKGFEGIEFVTHQRTGKSYLLALCEANKCSSDFFFENRTANNPGNGRLLVLEKRQATDTSSCYWEVVATIHLPSSIEFVDYSAVSIYRRHSPAYIAVTGQTDSQVWIGLIEEINKSPYFRVSTLKKNIIYNLPRTAETDSECELKYCNIEGVAWHNENQLILVSDKPKKEQGVVCIEKGQTIHYFSLPKH